MHALLGIALLGALIGYAFGEHAARAFIGCTLGFLALIAVGSISWFMFQVLK